MTSRNTLFIRRATLGLLLLAHLFLQAQVAIACIVQNLPGEPCDPGVAAASELLQDDKGVDCCQAQHQPASALYDAAAPASKDAALLAADLPAPLLFMYVGLPVVPPLSYIPIFNEASPPGVLGTDLYLATLRLRI